MKDKPSEETKSLDIPVTPSLTEINNKVSRDEVIRHLELMLQHAKDGDLIGLHYVALWHAGNVSSHSVGDLLPYARTIIGELHRLQNYVDAVLDETL